MRRVSRAAVLASGQILDGRYRVDAPVGEGGFATVYSGFHLTLGVRVAIKVLHLSDGSNPEREADLFADFIEEAKLVTRLRHDHIVRTLDQGIVRSEDGRPVPYLVMEWCGEESLAERLKREQRIPLNEAYAIVSSVADAMAHAHSLGVVHRDLKPANIMLASEGARVIDFGVAKVFEGPPGSDQTITRSNGKYTPAYAAPEQIAGTRTGPYTDVHAIGLLFYELATGQAPFTQGALGNIDPERPTPARVGVDVGAFEAVIAKAVSLRPGDRYQDATELARALEKAARKTNLAKRNDAPPSSRDVIPQSVETGAPTISTASPPQPTRRAPILIAIAAVLAIGGYALIPRKQPVTPAAPPPQAVTAEPSTTPTMPPPVPSIAPTASAAPSPKKTIAAPTKSEEKSKEASNAPSASLSTSTASSGKGIGGIIEKPPF
jgi:eukaryotic-like serine/threonine-protein kinase